MAGRFVKAVVVAAGSPAPTGDIGENRICCSDDGAGPSAEQGGGVINGAVYQIAVTVEH